jgi:polyhydroxyalkanoate synthesis regulator phasin
MNKALQRYLDAASGITNLTTNKAEQVVKGLVRSGEAAGDQAEHMVKDLLDRQQRNRDAIVALVKSETTRAVRAMGLATGTEVERLQKQVADLKRELTRVEREAAAAEAAAKKAEKSTAKKSTAKKATAKKSTAKKSTAKKSTAKKSTAKKSTAKKSTGEEVDRQEVDREEVDRQEVDRQEVDVERVRRPVAVGYLGWGHRRRLVVSEEPRVEGPGATGGSAPDPLTVLRAELEGTVDQLPVGERVARFEHANDVLAAELAQLDEV